jgi:proteasome lid subunit RPN8/RPN11
MSEPIRLGTAARRALERHGAETYPHECCGALFADANGTLVAAVPLPNTTDEGPRRRFLISADDYRRAEAHARTSRLELAGFYHSHPDHPARPSQTDLERAWPNLVYTITSVRGGEVAETTAWILRDDRSAFDERAVVDTGHGVGTGE